MSDFNNTTKQYPIMVLLVDDQPIIAETISAQLANENDIAFHYCQQGEDALKTAINLSPTVILQDLILPDIDGMTLVRYYRANRTTHDIPIIVLSSKEEADVKAEAFAAGANDYLVKLPDEVELIARLRYHSNAFIHHLQRNDAYRTLHESQQNLTSTNIELERKNQELANFAHMVAHDLKNPLMPIKGYAELMLEDCTDDDNKEFLTHIINNSQLMVQIINGLLAYSKSGTKKITFEPCNINDIITATVEQLHWQIADREVSIEKFLPVTMVMGCHDLLVQLFVNLFSNAIKYCPKPRTPIINIFSQQISSDFIEISVTDNGQGINKKDYDTIFNEFQRTEDSLHLASGSGIGLSTVKKIIRSHSGSIRVESEMGTGSKFIINLKRVAD